MTTCLCGRPLEKVPDWLATVRVTFVCNNCPNRNVKSITQVSFEPPRDPNAAGEEAGIAGAFDQETDEDDGE